MHIGLKASARSVSLFRVDGPAKSSALKMFLGVAVALAMSSCASTTPTSAAATDVATTTVEGAPLAAPFPQVIQARVIPRAEPCKPQETLPEKSYWNKPEVVFGSSDYVARLQHMEAFYDVPGELGYIAEGQNFGFDALSFIITETQPNGGPPLHVHETEEAHVLLEGKVEYLIGDKRFSVEGPYIMRVPPHVPHTFANRGPCPFNLLAVFPARKMSYDERGANPLLIAPK